MLDGIIVNHPPLRSCIFCYYSRLLQVGKDNYSWSCSCRRFSTMLATALAVSQWNVGILGASIIYIA